MENKRTETNKTVQKRLEPELKLINMDTVEVEQIKKHPERLSLKEKK